VKMLTRSTWTLTVAEPTVLPRSYSLELSKHLHRQLDLPFGEEEIPSVTCSSLMGSNQVLQDFISFAPKERYELTICGLQAHTAKAIASLDLSPDLEFLGARFEVVDRQDETTSYEAIYQTLVAAEPDPIRRFEIRFATPTAFAQNRTYLPLPVPTLMFRSWLERWNHFAPVYLGGDELISYLGEAIALSRHDLRTRSVAIHRGRVNGFIGNVTLNALSFADPLLANVAHLLIQYSNFAGTGIKTRLGMGQTIVSSTTKTQSSSVR
jgi:CRISPR-associated endoribonuclease Cas6